MEDIIRRLGNENFPRLRLGIGTPPEGCQWTDFVLRKFSEEEIPQIQQAVQRAAEAVAVWVREGLEVCMNQYNGDNDKF